jgi:hypothetical protein
MKKLFKVNKYFVSSVALFLYLIVINRASYLAPLVFLILLLVLFLLYNKKITRIKILLVFISMFYFFLGVANGNLLSNIFKDFIYFTPIILFIADDRHFYENFIDDKLAGLNKMMPYLLLASLGLFIYMGYSWTVSSNARFEYDQESKLNLFAPITPIFMIPFMLCYTDVKYKRILVYIGAFFILFMGYLTQTKTVFIPVILPFLFAIVFNRNLILKFRLIIIIFFICGIIYFILFKFAPNSIFTFMSKFNMSDDSNIDRVNESVQYLNKCNILQLLFGKGFGGIKTFHGEEFIGGIDMIHFGMVHLIMKGGFILLIIMYFPLLYIIIKDFGSHNYSYVGMAIIFMFMDLGHTQWQSSTGMLVYWLLVYYRFYKKIYI